MGDFAVSRGVLPTDDGYRDDRLKYDDCWDFPGYSQAVLRHADNEALTSIDNQNTYVYTEVKYKNSQEETHEEQRYKTQNADPNQC
jgi:hypothetical protein